MEDVFNINIMYLSRVIIRNYRSIEYLNVEFNKGKNAIVGKNNFERFDW